MAQFANQQTPYLTAREVARLLGCAESTVYAMRAAGRLPAVPLGTRSHRFPRARIEQIAREGLFAETATPSTPPGPPAPAIERALRLLDELSDEERLRVARAALAPQTTTGGRP